MTKMQAMQMALGYSNSYHNCTTTCIVPHISSGRTRVLETYLSGTRSQEVTIYDFQYYTDMCVNP